MMRKIYAPVSIRLLLTIAALEDLELNHFDVEAAFLEAPLDKPILMRRPEGLQPGDEDCLLQLCLYGTKQAPYLWNAEINQFLTSCSFTRSEVDPGIYFQLNSNSCVRAFISLYVDDLIIAGRANIIAPFIEYFKKNFPVSDLGDFKYVLGLEIERNRQTRTIVLHQRAAVRDILSMTNMQDCKSATSAITKAHINSCHTDEIFGFKSRRRSS
jgi:hypothetical protein